MRTTEVAGEPSSFRTVANLPLSILCLDGAGILLRYRDESAL